MCHMFSKSHTESHPYIGPVLGQEQLLTKGKMGTNMGFGSVVVLRDIILFYQVFHQVYNFSK